MKFIYFIGRWVARFRYPVSLPEEIGIALGITASNFTPFDTFFKSLTTLKQTRLNKFMNREMAEAAFKNACIRERFCRHTLCSYFFKEGWIEFILQFDQEARLRRIYILHKEIKSDAGIEIPLT